MSATIAGPRSGTQGDAGGDQHVTDDQNSHDPALDGLGDEGIRVDDDSTEEPGSEDQVPEDTTPEQPETTEEAPRGPSVDAEQVAQYQRENAELRTIVDDVYRRMQADPELARKLGAGGDGQTGSGTVYDHVDQTLRGEGGLTREAADVMMKALAPLLKDYEATKQELRGVRPQLDGLSRAVGSTEYQRNLTENGVSQEIQKSQAFQKFARQVENDPRVKMIRDASLRAEFVAQKWNLTNSRKAGYREDRTRIETAKTGRSGSQPARGASTAQRIVEVIRNGDHVERADRLRMEAVQNGKPLPTIRFVNPK